ncbi:MAG: acyl-CoA dehydrogenase family protein [Mycobacteriales bacterium]
MDLDLSDTEAELQSACAVLLQRHAGAARAKAVAGGADLALAGALEAAGFLDLFHNDDAGPVAATLVTELVAEAAGALPIGARALVGPAVDPAHAWPQVVGIVEEGSPVRFAAQADVLLVLGADEARVLVAGEWESTPVPSKYGYPLARVRVLSGGRTLGPGSAEVARRWWRVALAAEIAGTARAALDLTNRYLKEREQFGKPIGAFQALQHRIVECVVQVEGVRWLAREAADLGAPADLAASAVVAGCLAARLVTQEVHQLTGAMGFTLEYDLHVWSPGDSRQDARVALFVDSRTDARDVTA